MIKIIEAIGTHGATFTKIIDSKTHSVQMDITYSVASQVVDGITYYLIYDPDSKVHSESFGFLNNSHVVATNTRKVYAEALKLLFIYETIIDCKVQKFTESDINGLTSFLAGTCTNGANLSFHLCTQRQNVTINQYLSIYREYCRHLGADNDIPMLRKQRVYFGKHDTSTEKLGERYKYTLKTPDENSVPMYISLEEAQAIIAAIWEYSKAPLRDQIIVVLAYEHGLRIGEILGLTADDILKEYDPKSGRYYTAIYLRNRVSDRPDQQAKTCMSVTSEADYKSNSYQTEGYGYQKIIIDDFALLDSINEYIDHTHSALCEADEKKYWTNFRADRVNEVRGTDGDNFYIFANLRGNRLTQSVWSKNLRKIFEICGIPIDKGHRTHNLSHRLRHGCAMKLVEKGADLLLIQTFMRHKSITSSLIYLRPTTSDIIKQKAAFHCDSIMKESALATLGDKLLGDEHKDDTCH